VLTSIRPQLHACKHADALCESCILQQPQRVAAAAADMLACTAWQLQVPVVLSGTVVSCMYGPVQTLYACRCLLSCTGAAMPLSSTAVVSLLGCLLAWSKQRLIHSTQFRMHCFWSRSSSERGVQQLATCPVAIMYDDVQLSSMNI
jgi:hypothetical protein